MANYARINSENVVTYVTSIPNEMITDENGVEHEHRALAHLYSTIPDSVNDRWIQTSYNGNFRVRYAGLGFTYDEQLNAFLFPKPFPSWVLSEETLDWESPLGPSPKLTQEQEDDGYYYEWNEEETTWDLKNIDE